MYGQNCTKQSEEKYFRGVHLHYNHVAPISGDNYFLVILTDLGTVISMLEMATSDYAIAGGVTLPSENSKDFVKTNDIQAVARKYKLPSSSLPTGTVFYYVGKYRMATDGIALVMLTITDAENSEIYYIWHFQFGSLKNVGCNPVIKISNW